MHGKSPTSVRAEKIGLELPFEQDPKAEAAARAEMQKSVQPYELFQKEKAETTVRADVQNDYTS